MSSTERHAVLQFWAGLSILRYIPRSIGREADVTRTWFSVIAAGALAAGCAEPNPPPPAPQSAAPAGTVAQPADATAPPEGSPSGLPQGRVVGGMPPSAMNANPPGTPSYVIHPGDPAGRQVPRPGGAPAF
jgi:hypothetical protein